MRISPAALLLPLAVLLVGATSASEISNKAKRSVYQARSLAICQVAMVQGQAEGFEPADASEGCRCTIDSFMTGKTLAQLPRIEIANFRTIVKDELASCLDRMKKIGAKRGIEEAEGAKLAPGSEPVAADRLPEAATAPPGPAPEAAPADVPTSNAGSPGSTVTAWLASVPLWAWGLFALFILLIAARKLAGRGDRRDLLGVPRSMRSGLSGQPRRPDPPRS